MNEDKNFSTPQTEENQSIHTEEPASTPTSFPQTNSVPEQEYPAQNPQFEPPTQPNTDNLSSVTESPRKQRLGVAFYTFLTISVASIIYLSYLWFFAEDTSGLLGLFMTIFTIPFVLVGIIGMITSLIHGNLRPKEDSQINSPALSSEASKPDITSPLQQRKRFRRLLIFLLLNLFASIIMAGTVLALSFDNLGNDASLALAQILGFSNLLILPVLSTVGSLGAIVSLLGDLSAKKSWRLYTKKQTFVLATILLISIGMGVIGSIVSPDLDNSNSEEASEQVKDDSKLETVQPEVRGKIENISTEQKQYTAFDGAYQFKYPTNWIIREITIESTEGEHLNISVSSPEYIETFSTIPDNGVNISIDVDNIKETIENQYNKQKQFEYASDIKMPAISAYNSYEYRIKESNLQRTVIQKGQSEFTLTLVYASEDYDKYIQEYGNILSSFTILKS